MDVSAVRVERIFHRGAPAVSPAESLREAAAAIRSHGVSCLPVMSLGRLVGTLTEPDLLEAAAEGVGPSVAHVSDYMTDSSVAVSVEDDSAVAAAKMLAIGCRHLPVIDRGELVGVVSVRDVFLASAPKDAERMLLG